MNQNADAAELRKFGDLAHRWWDTTGAFRPLHEINPLRLDWIDRLAPLAGRRVVDVGCGGGILSESMHQRGAEVTGIDLSEKALRVAQLHALETGSPVAYRCVSAEDLAAEAPGRFDVVTCMEMLEHVPDPARTVRACAQLARPGGTVFFSTINRNPRSFLFAIIGAEYVLRLLPRGTHDYGRFIKPSELRHASHAAGLEWIEMLGMTYNPLTRAYALEPDVRVNYLVALRKPE
ncbi:MAG TPA: bifunctional 2-polyprenyl-6-hydroxyphenol methylase/3-demethylubiquinol 3-O-methyltransferase UbiG [Burkholderiaceae bacterium]|nr:bifunctional 2-polyprenyl-6-hydroxyphenol methylase/3-demethylubiquinol 3-O-methyltransferase UbiG [Burkholderiaceae bacterium]